MERKVGLRTALWMLGQVWYDGVGAWTEPAGHPCSFYSHPVTRLFDFAG